MKKYALLTFAAAFGLLSITLPTAVRPTHAQDNTTSDFVPPTVFQAAGKNVASIQSSVDAFRAALGTPINGNNPGPLATGRKWPRVVAVDRGSQCSAERIDRALNRGNVFPGSLEHSRGNKITGCVVLRVGRTNC